MEEILREHAAILRSIADELEAVADAMSKPSVMTPVVMPTQEEQVLPFQEPEGVTSTVYTVSNNINMGTIYQWANADLKRGYRVYFKDALTGLTEEYYGEG
ncbi:MAG: hypothetical protein E6Q97_08605 [Desulfurellales bacterium]|nr:MAG: hypothetical protein E6Q97_08605 [Desulfurellales bacterium]